MSADLQYSLASLGELVFAALDIVRPSSIVEIGAAEGDFTAELLTWAGSHGAYISAIDSAPSSRLKALAANRPELRLVEAMSIDALPAMEGSDAFVVDGDHNYYTVNEELRVIGRLGHPKWSFPLVFLHDVCWPWGRRDCYYNREALPAHAVLPNVPAAEFGPWGRTTLADSGIHVASHEGGPRNGVLTAAEDFAATRDDLRLAVIPAFHGLGILYPREQEWVDLLETLIRPWDRHPVIARLEADRIDKLNAMAALNLRLRET